MYIVGLPKLIIPPFSMFQYGRELENFTRGGEKYNCIKGIMNICRKRLCGMVVGRDSDQQTKLLFCIDHFGSIFITQKQSRLGGKGWIYIQIGGSND